MLDFSIITLFPEMFQGVFDHSIIKRAQDQKILSINYVNLRNYGIGRHKVVDDKPYGGGSGMVLRVDVLDKAIQASKKGIKKEKVILLDPRGKTYNQKIAEKYTKLSHIILICGHYEGFDERVRSLVDEEVSIGNYVLSGGEIPAMVVVDSITRLLPGTLKKTEATALESFSKINNQRILEYPQYTRPNVYKNRVVPKILLSGDPKKIEEYRKKEALKITTKKRPDILNNNFI